MEINNRKTAVIVLVILFVVVAFFLMKKGSKEPLVSTSQKTEPVASQQPEVNNYNAPKEVIYDNSTDLELELESINPQVLDSDFDSLP